MELSMRIVASKGKYPTWGVWGRQVMKASSQAE